MELNRRDFLKFGAAAGTAALLGWYVNLVNKENIDKRDVPGAGEPGHFTPSEMDLIDRDAYLSACSRCGVCIAECPFDAIKSTGWQLPLLTDGTRHKCPGLDVCGICVGVCPTSALEKAHEELIERKGLGIGEKAPWWEGKKYNTDFLTKPETEEGG